MDAIRGVKREISFQSKVQCGTCHGTGTKDGKQPKTCHTCNGSGVVCISTSHSVFQTGTNVFLCVFTNSKHKVAECLSHKATVEHVKEREKSLLTHVVLAQVLGLLVSV